MLAERVAAWSLRLHGYRVLARRYRTPVGEIDLVVRRGSLLAFVEVKGRPVYVVREVHRLPAAARPSGDPEVTKTPAAGG